MARHQGAQNGPTYAHIIDDLAALNTACKLQVGTLYGRARDLAATEKLDDLMNVLSTHSHDIEELRIVNYRGLQRVFYKPECIVLGNLTRIAEDLHSIAARDLRAYPIPRLYQQDTDNINQRLIPTANGIIYRLAVVYSGWNALNTAHGSPLCPTALGLNNGISQGQIEYVDRRNLDRDEKDLLRRKGGSFQFWRCRDCQFKKTFYLKNDSRTFTTSEESFKDPVGKVNFKQVFLARSHVHKDTYACLICLCQGKAYVKYANADKLTAHMRNHDINDLPDVFMRKLHITTKEAYRVGDRYDLKFW